MLAAVALLGIGVVEAVAGLTVGVQSWYVVAMVPVVTLPVATRRTAPAPSVAVLLAGMLAQAATGSDLPGGFAEAVALVLAVYAVGSRLPLASSMGTAALAVVAVVAVIALTGDLRAGNVVFATGQLVAAWGAGRGVRLAEDRSHLLAEHRALQERGRIARELHDVVSHQVTAIVIEAGAARRDLDPNGDAARTLHDVERRGRETLQELRRLLGVLRVDHDAPLTPQPGLAELPDLVSKSRRAGLDVRLASSGEPTETSDGLELTVYRVVQEALTNAVKHQQQPRVEVTLEWQPQALGVEIRSEGQHRGRASATGGFGVPGMQERVAAYGGDLVAAAISGGFVVHAVLPLEVAT